VQFDHARIELNAERPRIAPPIARAYALGTAGSDIGMAAVRRRPTGASHRRTTAITGVHPPVPNQAIQGLLVSLTLIGLKRSPIPLEPEPGEIPLQMVDITRFGSFPIEIFETKDDLGPCPPCVQPAEERGEQRAWMRPPCGRRRKTTAIENRGQNFRCHCNRFIPVVKPSEKLANRVRPCSNFLYGKERRTEKRRMHAASDEQTVQNRRIGLHLTPRSLSPRVLEALRALGYPFEEFEDVHQAAVEEQNVWLIDADRLSDFPDPDTAPDARLLLIAPPTQKEDVDPRIFARTTRPGRLGAVYGMIQSALELTPRRCPRIPTQLAARCIRSDRRSIGAVLSLSEGGCLLRTKETLHKGTNIDVQFALPDYGLVSTAAECRYVRRGDAGLAFESPAPDIRKSIAHYVTLQLATNERLSNVGPQGDARSA